MESQKEVSIKRMLYTACMRWRIIVRIAILVAVFAGGYEVIRNISVLGEQEAVLDAKREYEIKLSQHESEGREIENAIAKCMGEIAKQREYNQKSLFMQIDPYNEWTGMLYLYMDTGYQIMPNASIQNENPATKIGYAYYGYIDSTEFYQDVMDRVSTDISEVRYLKEILTVTVNFSGYSIIVQAKGTTETFCRELLDASKEAIEERYSIINDTIAEHDLIETEPFVYSQINYETESVQITQQEKIQNLNDSILTLKGEMFAWEQKGKELEKQEPIVQGLGSVIISGAKKCIMAGFAAVIIMLVLFCVVYVLSGKVVGPESLPKGLHIIGELPKQKKKKKSRIDNIFNRIFMVTLSGEDRAKVLAAAVCNTCQLYDALPEDTKKSNKVVLVSDVDKEQLETLSKQFAEQTSSVSPCSVVPAGNILTDAEAARAAYEADAAILIVEQDRSIVSVVEKVMEQLRLSNRQILGMILTEVDTK